MVPEAVGGVERRERASRAIPRHDARNCARMACSVFKKVAMVMEWGVSEDCRRWRTSSTHHTYAPKSAPVAVAATHAEGGLSLIHI